MTDQAPLFARPALTFAQVCPRPSCEACQGTGTVLCECDRARADTLACWACSGRSCGPCGGTGKDHG
jgi:hypothetical protein